MTAPPTSPPAEPPPPSAITLTGVQAVTDRRRKVTQLVLHFSGDLGPGRASDLGVYRLAQAGRHGAFVGRGVKLIRLRSASYDPSSRSVTLSLARPLKVTKPVQLRIGGLAPSGLIDRLGRLIDGNRDGQPGGDAAAVLQRRAIALSRPARPAAAVRAAPFVGILPDPAGTADPGRRLHRRPH